MCVCLGEESRHHALSLSRLELNPLDALDEAECGISQLSEGGLAEVEIIQVDTTRAFVHDGDGDFLTAISDFELLATDGVQVGVGGGTWVGVEVLVGNGDDELTLCALDTARAEAGGVVGD